MLQIADTCTETVQKLMEKNLSDVENFHTLQHNYCLIQKFQERYLQTVKNGIQEVEKKFI